MRPWKKILLQYLDQSTIHGIKYISNTSGALNKCIWTVVIVLVFALASCLIYKSLSEAANNPMTTYIDTKHVSEIPFPAVTVSASYPTRPQGFMGQVLDRFCFDQAGRISNFVFTSDVNKNNCSVKNSTFLLRQDFKTIIEQVKLIYALKQT